MTATHSGSDGSGVLAQMVDVFRRAPSEFQPSHFWERVSEDHQVMLSERGMAIFKQTINNSYFQMGSRSYWRAMPHLLASWLRHPSLRPMFAKVKRCEPHDVRSDPLLSVALGLLYWHLRLDDQENLFTRLREPEFGCPTTYQVGPHVFTQDFCHSVSEFSFVNLPTGPSRVAELGAGYGRLAWLFLEAREDVSYYVIDIPPALYVSQTYLTDVLPEVQAFRFRDFNSFADVEDELHAARLVFLEPQQLRMFPDDYFNAFLTVSSLAEMTAAQVDLYVSEIDRLCSGTCYLKQWEYSRNPFDDFVLTEDSYPIPERWELLARRQALAPRRMFERLYRCRPEVG